jgi:hypothetical protein
MAWGAEKFRARIKEHFLVLLIMQQNQATGTQIKRKLGAGLLDG